VLVCFPVSGQGHRVAQEAICGGLCFPESSPGGQANSSQTVSSPRGHDKAGLTEMEPAVVVS